MDKPNHHIDNAFKERFAGLKDHSISPKVGWAHLEAGLQASTATTSSVANGAYLQSLWQLGMAASVAIGLAVVTPTDSTPSLLEDQHTLEDAVQLAAMPIQAVATPLANWTENKPAARATETSSHSSTLDQRVSMQDLAAYSFDAKADLSSEEMDLLSLGQVGLTKDRVAPFIEALDIQAEPQIRKQSRHLVFLKGMFRTGTGESNSFEVASRYAPNAAFAFGYGYQLTQSTSITAEIGWVRRSGNGLERRRQLPINPAVSGMTTTLGGGDDSRSIVAHEGLVATRMDYIHIPIRVHQAFNPRYNFTAGAYADVLIAARNRSFIIYHEKHYQEHNRTYSELSTLAGLNKLRYGLTAGIDRFIHKQVLVGATVDVPLNNALSIQEGVSIIDEPSRLVDLRIGITYRL